MELETNYSVSDDIRLYLDEIAERLLTGHATLMVGAGFSKNAAPVAGVKNKFPNWNELGEFFFEKIHGKNASGQIKFLSPLKLAEEIEVLFGRPALDNLLTDKIPDDSHKPTELYTKLLQLEWRDVFTTNFDTLLERATEDIVDRNYQVVVKKGDIVSSKSPRIIKLHGSFPSHTPFIITEEDYRIYPDVFAPFVNTVHQALLETTLCLIGFSADDPNFLKWIGWIRDQFKENTTSKIYLIGLADFSESGKKFLYKRNINIVDFSNCPDVNGDHAKAIERFVDYLTRKKSEEYRLDWPNQITLPTNGTENKIAHVIHTVEKWKSIREKFPGWRIVPKENRKKFHPYIREFDWVDYVKDNLQELNLVDIQYVFEYFWQLDKCLLPIPDHFAALAELCLAKYHPTKVADRLDSDTRSSFDWNSVKEQWVQISIYLLRYYREEGKQEKWDQCESNLSQILDQLSEEQVASINYERSLQQLFKLNTAGLEDCLNSWLSNKSLLFFEAKRAGLLAEIGRLDDAQKILETSLKSVRNKQNLKPVSNDYSNVSDEAYLMLLLRCVKQSIQITTHDYSENSEVKKKYSERLNYLRQFKCSPLDELTQFSNKLDSPYIESKEVCQRYSFRVGEVKTTQLLMFNDYDALEGYSFLRFCEDIALPYHLPGLIIATDSAKNSLSRIGNYSPHWALISLIRVGDVKAVEQIYNRKYVYQMSIEQCDSTIDHLLNTLGAAKNDIANETSLYPVGFGAKLAGILPTILSRLCCKSSDESKQRLFEFVVKIYSSEHKSKYKGTVELVQLLFDSMTRAHQIQSIPNLLNIPIPTNMDLITERNYLNPFIFLRKYEAPKPDRKSISNDRITYYINKVKSKNQKVRDWAIFTLGFLSECNLLTDGQKNRFVKAAWCQTDSYGFPISTIYLKHFWLHFQHHDKFNGKHQIEKYVSEMEIPSQSESADEGIAIGQFSTFRDIANELIGAQRSMQFGQHVYELWWKKIQFWWENNKKYLRHHAQDVVEEFQARASFLITVTSEFILPNLAISNNSMKEIQLLVSDLQSYGMPTACIKAASNMQLKHETEEIISAIQKQLTDDHISSFHDAIEAIEYIVKDENFDSDVKRNLVILVLDAIIWRAHKVVNFALNTVSLVVKEYPELIDSEIERMILLALDLTATYSDLENGVDTMELEEKLSVRRDSACLAYDFYLFYQSKMREVPQEINKWKSICESTKEFAEVRNQWKAP